jgi:hypothetical protein
MSPTAIAASTLLPAAIVAAALLAAWRPWRKPLEAPRFEFGSTALPLAAAVGWIIALRMQESDTIWSLRQRWHWLVVAAAASGGIAALVSLPWLRGWLSELRPGRGDALALNLAAVAIAFTLRFTLHLPGAEGYSERLLLLLVVLLPAILLWPPAAREPGATFGAAVWIAASGLSAMVLMSGFAKLAISIGAIASAAAAAAVLAAWGRRSLGANAGIAFAAMLAAASAAGRAYDDSGLAAAIWILPLASLLVLALPLPQAWGELRRSLLRLAVVLLLVGTAVAAMASASGAFDTPSEEDAAIKSLYGFGEAEPRGDEALSSA